MLDILIKNAMIVDGSGKPAYYGSIGIEGDVISLVEKGKSTAAAKKTIDGEGLICAPGFIDSHSHADVSLPYYPNVYNQICQGITTFVGGNCGIGLAPALNSDFYKPYFASLDLADLDVTWRTFSEWLQYVGKLPIRTNYVPLVGLNPIRGGILGPDYSRVASDDEIRQEANALEEALDAGAFGLSFSLDPGVAGHYADQREMNTLCLILEKRQSLITAHTRHHQNQWPSEDGKNFYGWFVGNKGEAICGRYQGLVEFMEYYRRFPKLRSIISHLTNAFGVPQPHSLELEYAMMDETMEFFVDEPNRKGCDVFFNVIPDEQSIASSYRVATPMIRNMPFDDFLKDYATEDRMIAGLRNPDFRKRMKDFINGGKFKLTMLHPATDPYWAAAYRFVRCKDPLVTNKTLMELTLERMPGNEREVLYNNCIEVLFDILLDDPQVEGAMILDKREFAMERFLRNPRCMPITDSVALPERPDTSRNIMGYGTPPVAYTIFSRFFVNMCRELGLLSMEEGIRRVTSLPAYVMRIKRRGLLKEGYFADITMLDWNKLGYKNDFQNPACVPEGIENVIVNGKVAMANREMTEIASGRVLRSNGDG